jgi:prophage tail gpP-like protein
MIKKLIDFIVGLFCKKCVMKADAFVVKPSEEKQEAIEKKKKLEKLATAVKKKKNGK